MARFGALLFQVLALVQLLLAVSFSALFGASGVAQEKDRRTLILLLLTNLTNSELVLGKLLAGLLNVLVLVAASLPLFMLTALFGGVAFEQIGRTFAVTLASATRVRQHRFDDRTVARQHVSNPGPDGAGHCRLDRRRRSAGPGRVGS